MAPEAFFLPVANGQRFCLHHPAQGNARGTVLYLHPFAEEMNKSRRMAALQARRLAEHGFAVLQIDLFGCGDSPGDFGAATWHDWQQDALAARAFLQGRYAAPLWLWGLRTGCLLAAAVAQQIDAPANVLFWQPVVSGKQFLQQFLRLRLAGEMMDGESKGVMAELKRTLADGQSVEIAGYQLSAGMARGLEAAELQPPAQPGRLIWLELSLREGATLAPASLRQLEQWQAAGHAINSAVLPAPSFWQTTEIEEAPALLDATLAALRS